MSDVRCDDLLFSIFSLQYAINKYVIDART